MSAAYVREHYAVTYKVGDRLVVDGRPGTLVSFPGQYLGVRFDGDKHTSRCHPTRRVEPEPEPFGLVDLLARRPELRDVGIAGYLVDSALNDDATLRRWTTRRVQAQWLVIALMEHMARPIDMDVLSGKGCAS